MRTDFLKYQTLLITLFFTSAALSQNDTSDLKIDFRDIQINNGLFIRLQAKSSTLKSVAVESSKDHFYLKKGSFALTDSIDIEIDRSRRIVASSYFYEPSAVFNEICDPFKAYVTDFSTYFYKSDSLEMTVVKWIDRLTAFEIIEYKTPQKSYVYSVLYDLKLYSKKHENDRLFDSRNFSLEIARVLSSI
ncbi:MAG: hypothetical protein HYZ42_15230 [Bacteroidetes bacterium]|nr:hypothetical protein [Bacteroidota bacterium]